jgi:hypothetical protein
MLLGLVARHTALDLMPSVCGYSELSYAAQGAVELVPTFALPSPNTPGTLQGSLHPLASGLVCVLYLYDDGLRTL